MKILIFENNSAFDKNGDGVISIEELKVLKMFATINIEEAMDAADKNKDGFIDFTGEYKMQCSLLTDPVSFFLRPWTQLKIFRPLQTIFVYRTSVIFRLNYDISISDMLTMVIASTVTEFRDLLTYAEVIEDEHKNTENQTTENQPIGNRKTGIQKIREK